MPAKERHAKAENLFRLAKDLQEKRTVRDENALFFAEGVRNFVHLADNNYPIHTLLYSKKLCTAALARKLARRLKREGVPVLHLSPEAFRSISTARRASGIAAIVRQNWQHLSTLSCRGKSSWVVLEQVQSHGNLGTLLRTAGAVNNTGFIFLGHSIDPYAPDAIRASMGSAFGQRFVRTDVSHLAHWLKVNGLAAVGASPDGSTTYYEYSYPSTTFLMLGNERKGLSQRQRNLCKDLLHIPMSQQTDSLNLGVAASLILYEIYRNNQV